MHKNHSGGLFPGGYVVSTYFHAIITVAAFSFHQTSLSQTMYITEAPEKEKKNILP